MAPAQTLGCRKGQAGAGDGVEAAAGPDAPGDEKVVGLGLHGAVPQILSVDAQTSLNGGVVVHATGFLTLKGAVIPRPFAQVFFLAQQEIGYYVLNDLFCWLQREEAAAAPEPMETELSDDPIEDSDCLLYTSPSPRDS